MKHFPYKWKVPQYSLVSCLKRGMATGPTYHQKVHAPGKDGGELIWDRMEREDSWQQGMMQRQEIERQKQMEDQQRMRQVQEGYMPKLELENMKKWVEEQQQEELLKELRKK